MSDSLGLSVGTTNLVAARDGRAPVVRRSVLTVFNDRAPEVGVPSENPNLDRPGLVLGGFVDRVGDPVPLVASDGSSHRGEQRSCYRPHSFQNTPLAKVELAI